MIPRAAMPKMRDTGRRPERSRSSGLFRNRSRYALSAPKLAPGLANEASLARSQFPAVPRKSRNPARNKSSANEFESSDRPCSITGGFFSALR